MKRDVNDYLYGNYGIKRCADCSIMIPASGVIYCQKHQLASTLASKRRREANPQKYDDYQREYTKTHKRIGRTDRRKRFRPYSSILELSIGDIESKIKDLELLQNNCCAICGGKADKKLSIDHCHDHNQLRGLLCTSCNMGLGLFRDRTDSLRKAANYVEQYCDTVVGYDFDGLS